MRFVAVILILFSSSASGEDGHGEDSISQRLSLLSASSSPRCVNGFCLPAGYNKLEAPAGKIGTETRTGLA